MTSENVFIVNKLSLGERLDERVLKLQSERMEGEGGNSEVIDIKIAGLKEFKASLMHVSSQEKCVEITPSLEQKIRLEARKESGVVEHPFDPVRWLKCQELTLQKLKESVK